MMSAARAFPIVLLAGCNAVFGIDEGRLLGENGGAGTLAASGGSPSDGGEGGMVPSSTATGLGGACDAVSGLLNDTFTYFEDAPDVRPTDWDRFESDATINFGPGIGTVGVGMAVNASGPNALAGLTQAISTNWGNCVHLTGETYRSGGQGTLTATATFAGRGESSELALDLPGDEEFNAFSAACRLRDPSFSFVMRLENHDIPNGGTFSSTVRWIKLENICCSGGEPLCPSP